MKLTQKKPETAVTMYRAKVMLGISHYAVLAMAARGDLELVTVNGQPRVTRASVERWLRDLGK